MNKHWNELSNEEKQLIMAMYVLQGITDLNLIIEDYEARISQQEQMAELLYNGLPQDELAMLDLIALQGGYGMDLGSPQGLIDPAMMLLMAQQLGVPVVAAEGGYIPTYMPYYTPTYVPYVSPYNYNPYVNLVYANGGNLFQDGGDIDMNSYDDYLSTPETMMLEELSYPTYTVKKGDSLWSISRKHGITVSELRRANGMNDGENTIHQGDELIIPESSNNNSSKKPSKKQ